MHLYVHADADARIRSARQGSKARKTWLQLVLGTDMKRWTHEKIEHEIRRLACYNSRLTPLLALNANWPDRHDCCLCHTANQLLRASACIERMYIYFMRVYM